MRNAFPREFSLTSIVVIENCGHMPEMEKPAKFARLVENFLAG
jgi:pimeloyl-ACP methyl ester carboxylesterase